MAIVSPALIQTATNLAPLYRFTSRDSSQTAFYFHERASGWITHKQVDNYAAAFESSRRIEGSAPHDPQ
jgi:hypothetical protein